MAEATNNIQLLMEISGLDRASAQQILSINNNDLERAINFHLEGHPDPSQPGPSTQFYPPLPNMPALNDYENDDVRAPIPPKRETMILPEEDNFRFRKRRNVMHNVCPLRNFQREGEIQEAQLVGNAIAPNEENCVNNMENGSTSNLNCRPKRSRLEDLFRPPVELSFAGTLQAAREYAKIKNRWLIVNLQDNTEFLSQVLNRDIWSDDQLRAIVQRYFIFWQVAIDNTEGMRFQVFYSCRVFPYICIIDPRTGEEKLSYKNGFNFTATQFAQELRNYLRINTPYPNPEEAGSSSSELCSVDFSDLVISENADNGQPIIDLTNSLASRSIEATAMTEEDQLMMAIQNSLRESHTNIDPTNTLSAQSPASLLPKLLSPKELTEHKIDQSPPSSPLSNLVAVFNSDDPDNAVIEIDNDSDSGPDVVEVNIEENYKQFLGAATDPITKLVLRLPDGKRDNLEWPCTSQIHALKLYVATKYPQITKEPYKIICPFPRQDILELDDQLTLKEADLHPTVILHLHQDE